MILEILLQMAERFNSIVIDPISHPDDPILESVGYHGWYFSSSCCSSSVTPTTSCVSKSGHLFRDWTQISYMRSRRETVRVIPRASLIVVIEIIREKEEIYDSVT